MLAEPGVPRLRLVADLTAFALLRDLRDDQPARLAEVLEAGEDIDVAAWVPEWTSA
jgi:hypothetical protein